MFKKYITTVLRLTLIVGFVVLVFVITQGNAVGSTFATGSGTGALELKIDNTTWYNGVLQTGLSWSVKNLVPSTDKFFKFNDVKPGDTGTTTVSIHIKQNPAYVCLDFQNLKDFENGTNEPESLVDNNNNGELSAELEFFAWRDDGDNTFEVGEVPLFGTGTQSAKDVLKGKSYPLSDSKHGQPYKPNQTHYIGIVWCAGNLTVDVATAKINCDAEAMGNEAQTDSMTLDVSFRAVSSKEQTKFLCVKEELPPDPCEYSKDKDKNKGKDKDKKSYGGKPSSDKHDDCDDRDDDDNDNHHDSDDNHHDDDYSNQWHKKDKKIFASVKDYCVNAWNKVTKNKRT